MSRKVQGHRAVRNADMDTDGNKHGNDFFQSVHCALNVKGKAELPLPQTLTIFARTKMIKTYFGTNQIGRDYAKVVIQKRQRKKTADSGINSGDPQTLAAVSTGGRTGRILKNKKSRPRPKGFFHITKVLL